MLFIVHLVQYNILIIQRVLCIVCKLQKIQKKLKKSIDFNAKMSIIIIVQWTTQTKQVHWSAQTSTLSSKYRQHRQAKADKVGAIYSGLTGANWWLRCMATARSQLK